MKQTINDFKAFILRGNVVDLAIAVVIGAAFSDVVKSLVTDLLNPLIAVPADKPDFSQLVFQINSSVFHYGNFLNALMTFLIISAAVFFFVLKPINHLMAMRKTEPEVASTTKACTECLSAIPREARRCAFCTSEVSPAA